MHYIHREIESNLTKFLKFFPIVALTGPRQSGKSTLLQKMLPDYEYVTFDDFMVLEHFNEDPEGFMVQHKNRVIFDEAQKAPDIFTRVKKVVDENRQKKGIFVLSGSSQFTLLRHVSESLAGRIGLLSLLPLSRQEIPKTLQPQAIFKGGYPELVARKYESDNLWMSAYLSTYINRDVREIANIGDLHDFQRFIRLLAAQCSQQLNLSEIARDIGIAVSTVKRWISVLEASYIIFLLEPYHKNFGKRLIKAPKVYFYDTGIVSYLTGIKSATLFESGPMTGAIFENFVVAEIKKSLFHKNIDSDLYYLRSSSGLEIDLIVENGLNKTFMEIKSGSTYKAKMFDNINALRKSNEEALLIYRGKSMSINASTRVVNYLKLDDSQLN